MNKILNWTLGGFFRALGRVLAFVVIGVLVALVAQKNNLKITDLLGIGKVYASTTYSFSSAESRLYLDQAGTETTTSWYSIPHTFSPSYPVKSMQFRLQVSGGFDAGSTYVFKSSFLPSPDSIHVSGIWFSDGTNTLTDVNCSGWNKESNNYYANTCAVTMETSSTYLYVRIVFMQDYVTSIRSWVGQYEERKGVGAIITDSTLDVINNQNENTQEIIDNQNENTQAIIDSNKVCKSIEYTISYANRNKYSTHGYISNSSGSITNNESFRVSNYIAFSSGDTFRIVRNGAQGNGSYYCLYNSDKSVNSCSVYGSNLDISFTTTFEGYLRFSGSADSSYTTMLTQLFGESCQNGSQAISDTLEDDNVDESISEANDFFSSFSTDTHGLTGIITAPLSAIESLTSATCSPLRLPIPFLQNKYLELPCMRQIYVDNFGGFMNIYDAVTLGIVSYWILVRIFSLVKDFKNPEHDEIEVVDL